LMLKKWLLFLTINLIGSLVFSLITILLLKKWKDFDEINFESFIYFIISFEFLYFTFFLYLNNKYQLFI
jgi:hypothetical protein